jgi:tRNA(His) guanylyltransferase
MASIDFDALGDIQKRFEQVEAGRSIMPGIPILARLDGRSFHNFTKSMKRPFDKAFTEAMQTTAKALLDEFNADVAYTQSDEITLAWTNPDAEQTKIMFGGKFQKLCSLLAAHASVVFNQEASEVFAWASISRPILDCRVWQVPNLEVAASNFLWREMDATKNSVSMAASTYFSAKKLEGIGTKERKYMLQVEKDVLWEKYPTHFKKGAYFAKRKVEKFLSKEELQWIKPEHRPTGPVLRNVIVELDIPPATRIINFEGVLFRGEQPTVETGGPEGSNNVPVLHGQGSTDQTNSESQTSQQVSS